MGQEKFKIDNLATAQDETLQNLITGTRADKLVGTVLDGKIQIDSFIGQGGMSVVYKGTHLVLDRAVAVKVILPGIGFDQKSVLRLQQEAKAAYSLSHPNLASVHDVSMTSDGLPYLVMDFAGGETLADMLERGRLAPMKATEIFSQICAGLRAAHAQGVVHRDIKPGNIMVEHLPDGGESVKIVDFGIAKKVTENAAEIQKLTQTGEVFGTPLYMSPEQCRGDKLDCKSDIYSLGCVFYEALTGSPPFRADTSIATILQHLGKETPTPGKEFNLPRSLVDVLHKCLEKKSSDRYQSMDALYNDLEAIKKGGQTAKKYVKSGSLSKTIIITLASLGFVFSAISLWIYTDWNNQKNVYKTGLETIQACNQKIEKNPNDARAYHARANLNMGDHRYTRAIADYTECIRLNSYREYAYRYRAQASDAMARFQNALADCNASLALAPGDIKTLKIRAKVYRHLNQFSKALADADACLKIDSSDVAMLDERAHALIGTGRYQEAIKTSSESIKIDPSRSQPFSIRAHAYNFLHNSKSAIADADEAIRLNRDPEGYAARAEALWHEHQYDKALADVQESINLLPNQTEAKALKAKIEADQAKIDKTK